MGLLKIKCPLEIQVFKKNIKFIKNKIIVNNLKDTQDFEAYYGVKVVV